MMSESSLAFPSNGHRIQGICMKVCHGGPPCTTQITLLAMSTLISAFFAGFDMKTFTMNLCTRDIARNRDCGVGRLGRIGLSGSHGGRRTLSACLPYLAVVSVSLYL